MRQRQTGQADKLGIYIHIPFCRSKCDYCDFYSLAGREDRMDAYQKALLAHIRETAPLAQGIPVDTVYFGGGTPSWYGARRIQELLSALSKLFQVEKDAEITVEANPDSVDLRALRRLRKAGVNRLSLGMQSGCPQELESVHRPHTVRQVDEAVAAARKAKLNNVSLDLIYGLPGQTMDSWKAPPAPVLLWTEGGGGHPSGPPGGGGGDPARRRPAGRPVPLDRGPAGAGRLPPV